MLTHILRWIGMRKRNEGGKGLESHIIPRRQHQVSRANISKPALKVLYRLRDAGFQAYLVGGGVRDVLLGLHPKDFDVATDALPEEVQKLFQNCRLIGRRFRLAHVHFGSHIIEVATFRASSPKDNVSNPRLVHSEAGMILRDNVYGTLIDDVFRRDFTVNALYYNIDDFSVRDYVDGLKDLKARRLRMIGDANQRYREDPVRMLRAIRFAAKLNFKISPETETPIFELGNLVTQVPAARLLDEYIKMFLAGFGVVSFQLLRHYRLFRILFPETSRSLDGKNRTLVEGFITNALKDTDSRVREARPVALPFLLAAFLWYPMQEEARRLMAEGLTDVQAFYEASTLVLQRQQSAVALSRRLVLAIREIWTLQVRFSKRVGKRALQVYAHPRFRAGFDFLCLRAASGEREVQKVATWWKQFVEANDEHKLRRR